MASMNHQFDGASSLFSAAVFVPPESAGISGDLSISPTKNRGPQGSLPLTVKQIIEGHLSGDDRSNLIVDGVDVVNVKLLGMVTNKAERVTDVSFTLDDGTGQIDIDRWINEGSDVQELSAIQPVIDFNSIVLHFIECKHVHLVNYKQKAVLAGVSAHMQTIGMRQSGNRLKGYQAPWAEHVDYSCINGPANGICNLVLKIFQDPAVLAHDHGLHVDEAVKRLGLPKNMII